MAPMIDIHTIGMGGGSIAYLARRGKNCQLPPL
jgi:N-methylhydantoinase A/oxoprolinase/acetone carboxylase beta subunit